MKPEKLKVIAEGMGLREPYINIRGKMHYWCKDGREHFEYNPLTNNDKMVEIMDKLRIEIHCDSEDWWAKPYVHMGKQHNWALGKTINEAVCNAAYEYFKG